ncbi:GGDEF domain-containing protein [Sulfurimonas sp. SAG-AH-194-L11]|nr:GGDEF domain-containing protein [Sulfurimonas sp. SAG-AH-194-L11]MDF1877067.1 GGDEF domain-containing protein [Sulfurimonas sp. SAG-AH-194-L11]
MHNLTSKWVQKLELLDIAFQPILNIHTGKIYAVEALLRNFRDVGFRSIFELFDTAYEEGVLYSFDLALREKTFKKFTKITNYEKIKLFYNLDNRLLSMPDFKVGNTNAILKKLGIKKENICFEISERHEISEDTSIEKIITHYKSENFCIAIDDFGVGYSGYKLLFDSTPDIIKIDRYFLQDIDKSMKKQLMLRSITNLSIQLGIQVIAEGVETQGELLTCKEIGCHLVQGYLVQHPTKDTTDIVDIYQNIVTILKNSKRNFHNNAKVEKFIQNIPPLHKHQQMNEVVEYFKKHKTTQITPVVNKLNEPVGIFYENQIKEYLYSPYGISLLHNDTSDKSKLKNFIIPCANSDINSNLQTIIELFSNNPESAGIIITKNSSYYGFLSARAIISIMNEENLIVARDQNPLTKLPGNRMIQKYISKIEIEESSHMLCYFDLDNFKAFNDVYGFRNGDRVIQLFADIMHKNLPSDFFKAHIGGDDFFVANKVYHEQESSLNYISEAIKIFCQNAKAFYSQDDRERGHIVAKDRDGQLRKFPLLTVSASIILTNKKNRHNFSTTINDILSLQKKVAKAESTHIAISSII